MHKHRSYRQCCHTHAHDSVEMRRHVALMNELRLPELEQAVLSSGPGAVTSANRHLISEDDGRLCLSTLVVLIGTDMSSAKCR